MPMHMRKILSEYEKEAFEVNGTVYGTLYKSGSKEIVFTNKGMDLFNSIFSIEGLIEKSADYDESEILVGEGEFDKVYKFDASMVVKRYSPESRENGITQLKRLAYLDIRLAEEGIQNTKVPELYFATRGKLCMEYIKGTTWIELMNTEKNDDLMEQFADSGAMEFLSMESLKGNAETKLDNIIVREFDGKYEFVLVDQ